MSRILYNYTTSCENAYYTVQIINRHYGLFPFGYDENKCIFRLSNTLLHFICFVNDRKQKKIKQFEEIVTNGNYITSDEDIFINEDVIPFITNCSKYGSAHGYHDLISMIIRYLDDLVKYSKYKILIYKDSQQGLLDIVNHLCELNVLDKNNLIFIEANKIYKFKSICFIKNIYDAYDEHDKLETSNFLKKCLTFKSDYIIDKVSYLKPPKFNIDNILIVKAYPIKDTLRDIERNFDEDEVIEFCKKYNYTWIKPETMNEVVFYNLLNNGKKYIFSFGSSFHKNLPFINKNYQKIDVVSKSNTVYDRQMVKWVPRRYSLFKEALNLKVDINFHTVENFKDFDIK